MKFKTLQPWEMDITEAQEPQRAFAARVVRKDEFSEVRTVCGVDVWYKGEVER